MTLHIWSIKNGHIFIKAFEVEDTDSNKANKLNNTTTVSVKTDDVDSEENNKRRKLC